VIAQVAKKGKDFTAKTKGPDAAADADNKAVVYLIDPEVMPHSAIDLCPQAGTTGGGVGGAVILCASAAAAHPIWSLAWSRAHCLNSAIQG
jgi:hypothetical protein